MNIDEMKSNWQSAKGDINAGSELQPGRGRKTALQRLGDQYSRFSKFSLVFMLVSPLMLWIAGIRALWIGKDNLDFRMMDQESNQFAACIAGCTQYTYLNHISALRQGERYSKRGVESM